MAEAKFTFIPPVEIQASDIEPDDDAAILDRLSRYSPDELHIYRMGHMITVGTDRPPHHVGLVRIESPGDADYATMLGEAKPEEGIPPHHPV